MVRKGPSGPDQIDLYALEQGSDTNVPVAVTAGSSVDLNGAGGAIASAQKPDHTDSKVLVTAQLSFTSAGTGGEVLATILTRFTPTGGTPGAWSATSIVGTNKAVATEGRTLTLAGLVQSLNRQGGLLEFSVRVGATGQDASVTYAQVCAAFCAQ